MLSVVYEIIVTELYNSEKVTDKAEFCWTES